MDLYTERLQVLQQMERGEISMEEAAKILSRLERGEAVAPIPALEPIRLQVDTKPEPVSPAVEPAAVRVSGDEEPHHRSELWLIPFVLGLLLTVSSVSWMVDGYQAASLGWGFWLSFFPLALGVLMMWLGWEARKARWLHLRVTEKGGRFHKLIAFSFPIPSGIMRWGIHRFGKFKSAGHATSAVEFMENLDAAVGKDGPLHIFVNDDNEDKQVEIWID